VERRFTPSRGDDDLTLCMSFSLVPETSRPGPMMSEGAGPGMPRCGSTGGLAATEFGSGSDLGMLGEEFERAEPG
jgi:hypothetical protein